MLHVGCLIYGHGFGCMLHGIRFSWFWLVEIREAMGEQGKNKSSAMVRRDGR